MTMHQPFMTGRYNNSLRVGSGTWTIGDESTNVRALTLQLKDENNSPLKQKRVVWITVFSTTGKTALATGGSTGLAADTGSLLIKAHTAKLLFTFLTDANGKLSLTWTDTGTESVCVQAEIDGIVVDSAAFANA